MTRPACRLLFILLATGSLAAQQPPTVFRIERPIIAAGAGPQRLEIDVALLAQAQRFTSVRSVGWGEVRADVGLSDLRIVDGEDREVPYLLVHPDREDRWLAGTIRPVAATQKTSGFEADLGGMFEVDALFVGDLPAPFLKRLVLEGSGDRQHWTVLAGEGTLFDLPQERLHQLSVPFQAGDYRYLRITWDDTNTGRVPLPGSVRARLVPAGAIPRRRITAPVSVQRRASEPGRSRYRLGLPAVGLPVVAILLDVGPGHVFRKASVSEARFAVSQAAPVELGRDTLVRLERDGLTASALRIRVTPPREAAVDLVVEDGSNPPLDLKGVSIELADLPWIYFEAPEGPLRARYGNPSATAPRYDLEAVRGRLKLATVPLARWGEPIEVTAATAAAAARPAPIPATGAELDVSGFRYRRAIAAGSGGLTVLPLDAAVLAHSRGPQYSFSDVRLVDQGGRQIPYLLERRDEPIAMTITLRRVSPPVLRGSLLASAPGHNRSVYEMRLPYTSLPAPRLALETSDRVFRRSVQVVAERPADRAHRDRWLDVLASGTWQHAAPDVNAPPLELPLRTGQHDTFNLLLVVDEGDDRPLTLTRATLLLPSWRLRFFDPASAGAGAAQPITLLYGHDRLPPPQYDLALLAAEVMGAEAREASAAGEELTGAPTPPSLVTPRAFWVGLGAAVLVLLAIIAKLVAGSSASPSQPLPPAP